MKAGAENYIIQTVSRAMDLLEQFQDGDAELGITDLSNRLNLQKNNVFRLVSTLKAKNYIEINALTGKYRLGIKTRALGQVASRRTDYAHLARPFLNELKKQCHETCYFSVIRDGYSYCLDGVESDLPVRVAQRVGISRPLLYSAAGKVLLACASPLKQMELLAVCDDSVAPGGINPDALWVKTELMKVAQRGYEVDNQQHDAGVVELAAPVFDVNNTIVGALSILGPEMRLTKARLEDELIPLLCRSADDLSALLGHRSAVEAHSVLIPQLSRPKGKGGRLKTKPYAFSGVHTFC